MIALQKEYTAPTGNVGHAREEMKRILVVDDDDIILSLLVRSITGAGYRVDTAVDGNDGWQSLELNDYDLLVTDHNMPGMTGLDLIRKVRQTARGLPCVLFSSLLPMSHEALMKIIQCGSVVEKTSAFSNLLTEIVRLLSSPTGESPPDGTRGENFIVPLPPLPPSGPAPA